MEYHISFEDHLAGMPAPAAPRYIRSIERRGRQNNFSDMSLLGGFSSRSQCRRVKQDNRKDKFLREKPNRSLGDDGTTNHYHHHRQCHQLQTALARVLDEIERNQKKESHLNTISKMMGTLVHVQLYTFSYRKPVIRPQNMPKTADWG